MRIDILTLFPSMFDGVLTESILKRAINDNKIIVNIVDFREYSLDPHKKVDDTPYGGGAGMVLQCQPIFDCVRALKTDDCKVIMMTPSGEVYNQKRAYELSREKHLIIICGHYEGFDERIRSICDLEISIGDYVLTGGEIPSMVILDSVVRLVSGVINNESHENDSFNNNLLDYPTYTKPQEYEGMKVPDVLLSGNHQMIKEYRYQEQLKKTRLLRGDLLGEQNEKD